MEPLDFLRRHPPFDRLDERSLGRLGSTLEIAYYPSHSRILRRGGARSEHLYVVRKGSVRLERDGQLVQTIEEGEPFGFPSLIGRTAPHVDAVAAEDTLLYQVPDATFEALMESRAFADFFLVDLSERLRHSASVQPLPIGGELAAPVGRLPISPPVHVSGTTSVGRAAAAMRDAAVSAVVVDGDPPGILTDSDLRGRVLAEGRGPETPVAEVATRPIVGVPAEATLFETLVFMLEHHVHHAPVEREGAIVGILTDTDLLRLQVKNPLYMLRNLERLQIPADLPRYGLELSAMVEALLWGGLDATQVGPVVSRLNDTLVTRLLREAEGRLGPPPLEYAWLVLGSEGRMEQTLLTDQDNALAYADPADGSGSAGADGYFVALATRVVDHLAVANVPRCPGGFMATNWHRSLSSWTSLFRGWIETPEPRALLDALNFFDLRPVHGALDLSPLSRVMVAAGRESMFLAHLARASMGLAPPLGPFRQIRQAEGGVDLKKGGIVPIVGLARLYALEAQSLARGTLARLTDAAEAGTMSREGATTLAEAYRFLVSLRLREQLRAIRAGEPPGNRVRLEHLSALERQQLKDVFLAVREMQDATALRYATHRLA